MRESIKSVRESFRSEYPISGHSRPQILLIGNGLERKSGQVTWEQLVGELTVRDCIEAEVI